MRNTFIKTLIELAERDERILLLTSDLGYMALEPFAEKFPKRFFNVGIAEQNMVNVAAGLALESKKVFVYAIMPFATLRCYEVIKVNLSLMNIPVTVIGVGAGFSYDDSGPTHHSTEDITIMRALPNMAVLSPSDSIMAAAFARMSCRMATPNYVRLDREVLPPLYRPDADFTDGLSVLKSGEDVSIVATGNMVHRAIEVSDRLKEHSVNAGVIDLYRIKPINQKLLLSSIEQSKRVLTLEEHLLAGGLGSAVLEVLADNGKTRPVKRIGIQDKYYYAYGGRNNIQSLCGLDVNSITKTTLAWLRKND